MEIFLASERAFHLLPQLTLEVAKDRLEQKKINLVSGTVGALLSRPKPEEIQLFSIESRLEAFWLINVFLRTVYERIRTYIVPVCGREVHHVTTLNKDLPITVTPKGNASFSLNGVEHCIEERRHNFNFDGFGVKADLTKYLAYPKTEIHALEQFSPEGMLVVPPKASASTVMRSILAEVIKPVQAEIIHEERVNFETLDIYFRPVYALEYNWVPKNKKVVLEFDALTGEIHTGGRKMENNITGILSRDLLFDVTADAAGLLVPGGSIAVKLVKAAFDYGKK